MRRRSGETWRAAFALVVAACASAPGSASRSEAMGSPHVTLVPRAPERPVVTARLTLSDSSAVAGEAGTVELRARGDTLLEYSLRLRGAGGGLWVAAHLLYSGREGARQEQLGALFLGAAFSPATAQVRGTVSIGKTIPVRWLVEELRANPGRFRVVITDSQASAVTLSGRFQ